MFALGFLLLSPGIQFYTHPLEKIKTNISHVIIQYVRKTWVGAFDHEAVHVSSGETQSDLMRTIWKIKIVMGEI